MHDVDKILQNKIIKYSGLVSHESSTSIIDWDMDKDHYNFSLLTKSLAEILGRRDLEEDRTQSKL